MKIAITGASGQLGRLVTDELLQRVDATDLVLLTRDPSKLEDRGAEVRAFDWASVTPQTLQGVDKLLLISGDDVSTRLQGHLNTIEAAKQAGVGSVAYTSIVNPSNSNPAFVAPSHRATEDALRASGLGWTFLRNSIYADMLLSGVPAALATGKLVTNEGEGRTAFTNRADCAAVAAAVLVGDHDGKVYDITGPEALSPRDVAALLAELSGKPVEPVYVDDDAWVAGIVEHAGLPEPLARLLATFADASRRYFHAAVSDSFEEIVGRKPIEVRQVLAAAL
jgi:NAD(P)H dehydrogenase (quinone)